MGSLFHPPHPLREEGRQEEGENPGSETMNTLSTRSIALLFALAGIGSAVVFAAMLLASVAGTVHAEETYTYVFTGKATYGRQPCANATVRLQVISESGETYRNAVTSSDGSYTIAVNLVGKPNDGLSWGINAMTPDMQEFSTEGHQILMQEPSRQMDVPLMFVAS